MSEEGLQAEIGITLGKLEKQLARAEARMHKTAQKLEGDFKKSNKSVEKAFDSVDKSSSRASRGGLRNVGLQLNQVAQQGMVTGNYMQALAIQLPDLMLGFGGLGVAIGLAAGVMGPFLMGMMEGEDKVEDLSKTVDGLASAVSDYADAAKRAMAPSDDLKQKYGELADDAERLFDAEMALSKVNAISQMRAARAAIAGAVGVVPEYDPQDFINAGQGLEYLREQSEKLAADAAGAMLDDAALNIPAQISAMGSLGEAVIDVAEKFGITEQRAGELLAAIQRYNNADGLAETVEAGADLEVLFAAIATETGNVSAEFQEMAGAVAEVVRQSLGLKEVEQEISGIDLSANVRNAAAAASAFADELSRALNNLISLQAQGISSRKEAEIRLKYKGDPVATAGALAREQILTEQAPLRDGAEAAEIAYLDAQAAAHVRNAEATEKDRQALVEWQREQANQGRKAGGGSKLDETSEAAKIAQQAVSAARREVVTFEEVVAELNAQLAAGDISAVEFEHAIEGVRDKMGQIAPIAEQVGSALSSALTSAFTDPMSALDSLAMKLFELAALSWLSNAFPTVFGSDGIIPLAGSRATGGPVTAGQPYLVGERGPEIMVPGASGSILASKKTGGAGSSVVVNNYSPERAGASVQRLPDGRELVEITVGQSLAMGRFDGQLGGRYNMAPTKRKRG